jgi:hypothetical protein
VIEFTTQPGEHYLVESAEAPVAGYAAARVAPERAAEPRLPVATAVADLEGMAGMGTFASTPVLGITRSGISRPRAWKALRDADR